jgi:hypothetical protein
MAETKYGKYIKTELLRDISHYAGQSILSHDGELDAECSMGYHCIAEPISFDKPHSHDFAEMLCFIGGNPLDITDFGAEIDVTLGEEGEVHTINTAAVVALPPGLIHCPIVIKKVTKPIVFLEISLTRIWKASDQPPQEEDK